MVELEVGDKFIINWDGIKSTYPNIKLCKFPDLEFTIDSFSKSKLSVYYNPNDCSKSVLAVRKFRNRNCNINKNCNCSYCGVEYGKLKPIKSVAIYNIIITQRRLSIERSEKLKSLGL
jgi:hypothetical protein